MLALRALAMGMILTAWGAGAAQPAALLEAAPLASPQVTASIAAAASGRLAGLRLAAPDRAGAGPTAGSPHALPAPVANGTRPASGAAPQAGRSHAAGAASGAALPALPSAGDLAASVAGSGDISQALKIALLFTGLALLPTILMMMTSFVRMVIVFHFVRQALGTQTTPPNQILLGLALFLTLFVMYPTGKRVYDEAVLPYQEGRLDARSAMAAASDAPREWMVRNTREKDLMLFVSLGHLPQVRKPADLPMHVAIPAFVVSEMRAAFQIGFLIFLPFLVIDLVVSAVLLSSGMMMLPPVVVSFPFKILLFVMVDGWYLLVGSLVRSFH